MSISPSRTSSMFIFLPKQTPKLFRRNVSLEMLVGSGRDHLHLEQKQEFKKSFSIPGENRVGFGSSCKTGKLRLHFFTDSVGNQQQQQLQQKKEPWSVKHTTHTIVQQRRRRTDQKNNACCDYFRSLTPGCVPMSPLLPEFRSESCHSGSNFDLKDTFFDWARGQTM